MKTKIYEIKLCILQLVCMTLISCDFDSSVNTEEYIKDKNQFGADTDVERVIIYEVPYSEKNKYWKEGSLIKNGYKKIEFHSVGADQMWHDCFRSVRSSNIKNFSTLTKISLAVVFVNSKGEKYFAMFDRLSSEDGHQFVAVDGIGDDNWWFEARSEQWKAVFNSR